MSNEKRALREQMKLLRGKLCTAERNEKLKERFLLSPFFGKERFFVYLSVGSEADTRGIISALQGADKQVLVPRVEGGRMLAVPDSGKRELFFGIPQPAGGQDSLADVALVPLLAYDGEGYRLGYGGGYYDRYLQSRPSLLRVGLCFAGQAVSALPHGAHDIRLDAVVTEEGVGYFT